MMRTLLAVLPEVPVSREGLLTAGVCLASLAVGLHVLLRGLSRQPRAAGEPARLTRWPVRWTGLILAIVLLMCVAGVAVVGIGHQTASLVTSPEPLLESRTRIPEDASPRHLSFYNIRELTLAMMTYEEVNEALPPAAVVGRDGQPLLSWRVLLLPFVDQQDLYKEFHLDEAWDSPHNLRLLPRMPKAYDSQVDGPGPHSTHYQVFVGRGTAFEPRRKVRLQDDCLDGASSTILIAEAAGPVPWTKPEDLSYDPLRPLPPLGALSPQYFLVGLADGSCRRVDRKISEQTLRAAITRNDGKVLGPDW